MKFNVKNGVYVVGFNYDSSITDPSILFKSTEYFYPNGYQLYIYDQSGLILKSTQV